MSYLPQTKPGPVVNPGEFVIAAAFLDHGHIYGQCEQLIAAGAELRYVYEPDVDRLATFCKRFPQVRPVESFEKILENTEVHLVAAAGITSERGPIGCRVMQAGKDYFCDKAPFTTLLQLEEARQVVATTGRKYAVYYSERICSECAVFAGQIIAHGAIGRVVQVTGFGPDRLNAPQRPPWFFEHTKYGGILCDIGSHQVEQILFFSQATDARVGHAAVANYAAKDHPELEDFGEASLVLNNGASGYFRVDWLTPSGLSTWGDGRTLILGTKGYIELRKAIDIGRDKVGDHLLIVDEKGEHHLSVQGQVGFPYFGQLILDCLNRTEIAMTQEHTFKAAEISLKCQQAAIRLE